MGGKKPASMIRLELQTEFRPVKGATTADLVRSTHAAFTEAGLEPVIRFKLAEYDGHKTSAVARVTRRSPELARFAHAQPVAWEQARTERMLTNEVGTPGADTPFDLPTLLDIVSGVPRRYPFFTVTVRITHPAFGPETVEAPIVRPGVRVEDHWGATKRRTTRQAAIVVDADPGAPSLPPLSASVATVLDACGRRSPMTQLILSGQDAQTKASAAIVRQKVAALLDELTRRIQLPHDIPLRDDRPPERPITSRKPALAAAVQPLGYDCQGQGMGVLVCRRRSALNVATRLFLDFGTMRSTVEPTWSAAWLGGSLSIRLPSYSYNGWQGLARVLDETRWRQITENLAAIVGELDRSVVPVIEATAGPTPAWYNPGVSGWHFSGALTLPYPKGSTS